MGGGTEGWLSTVKSEPQFLGMGWFRCSGSLTPSAPDVGVPAECPSKCSECAMSPSP